MITRYYRQLVGIVLILFVSACGGTPITDFSGRSVVYAWIDLEEAAGNTVVGGSLYAPVTDGSYPAGYFKHAGGYIVYHTGIKPGPIKIRSVSTMGCIGLCGNTVNVYDFGLQGGDIGSAVVRNQGVYYLGSYRIIKERTGFFERGSFSVEKVNGPSRRQILEAILHEAPDAQKPLVQAAIQKL